MYQAALVAVGVLGSLALGKNTAAVEIVRRDTIAGVHRVDVGKNGLTFEPRNVTAKEGEIVEFHFWAGTHSVAEGDYFDACQPENATNLNPAGFYSGPITVSSGEAADVFSVTVNNSASAMWFYSAVDDQCQKGMLGVINLARKLNSQSFETYAERAADADYVVVPAAVTGGRLGPATTTAPTLPENTQFDMKENAGERVVVRMSRCSGALVASLGLLTLL
ncbi:hypothetical protein JX266_009394 [Neoarthrinium moseri]|uniref:uncharacterized protein n=1 Tax=Neoarthrinium moseri TaxID=1658444 RepID=UPI001FDDBE97|nr:uncharacterized protein JN550_012026 [Neoarthrinium moseri]KAI1844507.1 hypothetical protein JX266_009394 [Neoarthrinium moseri]KAI1859508.1 hypothetical protein JN550_012026 [Neoarthrinium moseri]